MTFSASQKNSVPLDHYVSQVHLRRFQSPELGNRLHAIRKADLTAFTPRAKDVCRLPDGSSNEYLNEPRAIEQFLRVIEPNYNRAVEAASTGELDQECVMAIAGFAAYVLSCSPAGMRLFVPVLRSSLEAVGKILDRRGSVPPPPPELGAATLRDLIEKGAIRFEVDPKYPQAIGIAQILETAWQLGNCKWEILRNEHSHSPFFTSDFPIGFERSHDPRVLNKVVPLSPETAVRILPDIDANREDFDLNFRRLRYRMLRISRQQAREINQLLVRCAEEVVFFRDDLPWVRGFVQKNRFFRVETETVSIPSPEGGFRQLDSLLVRESGELRS